MKLYFVLFLTLTGLCVSGQSSDVWTSFYNSDTTLKGYKDKNGVVKIEPKFTFFTSALKFENIIAAFEEKDGKSCSYYLTKQGRIAGRDSLYFFDNGADCESEGFIRFCDRKTDKTGIFNKHGEIVVPAFYNHLSRVMNGLIIAVKGAEKKYAEGGEHYSWVNGHESLIDTSNNVLIDNFQYNSNLNLFLLKKSPKILTDPIRKSFLAKDGSYYSFVDFNKEFSQWINKELQNNLTIGKLMALSYDTITWDTPDGWTKSPKDKLIKDNFSLIKNGLLEILQPKSKFVISMQGLNSLMFKGEELEKYFDNCGQPKDWVYPVMSIIISHGDKKKLSQNHFDFLRTDNGYKLICLTIRNGKMK